LKSIKLISTYKTEHGDVNRNKKKMRDDLPLSVTLEVRDRCLCLHLQRAARAIGRRFDDALKPIGLTNGQYSLLMSLNRPDPPRISDVARLLATDRTTLTANLKPLERRRLVQVVRDKADKRSRRLELTEAGRDILVKALPVWRATHEEIDLLLAGSQIDSLRADLSELSKGART
jgi:DNA-binding MarR family transcriptional regulator